MEEFAKKKNYRHGNVPNAMRAAAREILDEDGSQAVGLREMARRVGVSPTAAYRHFASREDLLASVAAEGFRELSAALEAVEGPDLCLDSVSLTWNSLCRNEVCFASCSGRFGRAGETSASEQSRDRGFPRIGGRPINRRSCWRGRTRRTRRLGLNSRVVRAFYRWSRSRRAHPVYGGKDPYGVSRAEAGVRTDDCRRESDPSDCRPAIATVVGDLLIRWPVAACRRLMSA